MTSNGARHSCPRAERGRLEGGSVRAVQRLTREHQEEDQGERRGGRVPRPGMLVWS